MSNYCSECTYLDLDTKDIYGKFWCDAKLERHLANEIACYRFCKAYNRGSSVADSAYNYSLDHSSTGGCYLTTIICNILGFSDNHRFLNVMRNFRNNTLQKDEKYKSLLVEYDIVGPKISEAISNDPLNKIIASKYLQKFIIPIVILVEYKKTDAAVNLYKRMTNELKTLYNIDSPISNLEIECADIKESGHGIYKTKKITSV